MKKNRYRIQIETTRSGEKTYEAHVDITNSFWFKWMRWERLSVRVIDYPSNRTKNQFLTITEAEEAINEYKKIIGRNYQNEIINVEYKYID